LQADPLLSCGRCEIGKAERREQPKDEDGVSVEFVSMIESPTPSLTNLTVECLPSNNMVLSCDLSAHLAFLLRTSSCIDLVMNLDRIRARLAITFITAERLAIAKFEGWPDLKMRLNPTESLPNKLNSNLADVEDAVAEAIRGTQLSIKTDSFPGFPTFKRTVFPNNQKKSLLSSFNKGGSKPHSTEIHGIGNHSKGKQMDVKVAKVTQLAEGNDKVQPYIVMEVDEPSQRFQTKTTQGSSCTWDDTFKVELTKSSSELLFEVWDQSHVREEFLGLAIVSVAELLSSPSQRHVLPLQGRPGFHDKVSGMLTIEFLLKDAGIAREDQDLLPGVYRTFEAHQNQSQAGRAVINKKTVYTRQESEVPDLLTGSSVAAMALKDIGINRKRKGIKEPVKSTLVMHSVQTIKSSPSGLSGNYANDTSTSTDYTDEASDSIEEASVASRDSGLTKIPRGRRPKRNLISTIKRRFTGTRSLSSTSIQHQPDNAALLVPGTNRVRSVSANRAADEDDLRLADDADTCSHSSDTDSGCSMSLASWRGSLSLSWQSSLGLQLPALNVEDGSSMSDVSGISATSNKSYISEDSSLVLETLENGRHHHYLIPVQAARSGRFKKPGTKLHVFMDHVFTAQHIKLGTSCNACHRLIPLRLGKQAYVCRDCGVTTHKQCHTKVESHCAQTSLPTMELEFYS